MDIDKLPPDTKAVWLRLATEPLLDGFVLIGGTALTLRVGHRISEDLDFAYLGDVLPRQRIVKLQQALQREGGYLTLKQDIATEQDFINAGLDLMDHQQNYEATGQVKVSFVRLDKDVTAFLSGNEASALRVATLDEIFKTKAIAVSDRNQSRDWFDLYILMTGHGYTIGDLYNTFQETTRQYGFDSATLRLRACKPALTDQGYSHLLENPPQLSEIRDFFNDQLDQWQIATSRNAFKKYHGTSRGG